MTRALRCLLAIACLLAACSQGGEATAVATEERERLVDELRSEVAAVATTREAADRTLAPALDAVQQLDAAMAALQREEGFDEQLASHDEVHAAVAAVDPRDLRSGWLDLASEVDEARELLASTREVLDGEWERSYLAAQDDVLLEVHGYAEASDRVAQVLAHHWEVVADADGRIVDFAPRRSNYRDTTEARDGLLVELDRLLGPFSTAQRQLAEQQRRRAQAADALNEASADAAVIHEQRPGRDG